MIPNSKFNKFYNFLKPKKINKKTSIRTSRSLLIFQKGGKAARIDCNRLPKRPSK